MVSVDTEASVDGEDDYRSDGTTCDRLAERDRLLRLLLLLRGLLRVDGLLRLLRSAGDCLELRLLRHRLLRLDDRRVRGAVTDVVEIDLHLTVCLLGCLVAWLVAAVRTGLDRLWCMGAA